MVWEHDVLSQCLTNGAVAAWTGLTWDSMSENSDTDWTGQTTGGLKTEGLTSETSRACDAAAL